MTGIIRAALLQIARSRGILAATLTAVLIAGGLPLIFSHRGTARTVPPLRFSRRRQSARPSSR